MTPMDSFLKKHCFPNELHVWLKKFNTPAEAWNSVSSIQHIYLMLNKQDISNYRSAIVTFTINFIFNIACFADTPKMKNIMIDFANLLSSMLDGKEAQNENDRLLNELDNFPNLKRNDAYMWDFLFRLLKTKDSIVMYQSVLSLYQQLLIGPLGAFGIIEETKRVLGNPFE